MTTEQHTALLSELIRIREALESRPAAKVAPSQSSTPRSTDEIPLPTEIIADAGEVEVHFGKNQGVPIKSLSDKSVAWYAQDQEPKLRSDGKPFPPRDSDVRLRNACRTYLHAKRGTASVVSQISFAPSPAKSAPVDDENVPF